MSKKPVTSPQEGGLGLRAKLWLAALAGAAITVAIASPFLAPQTGGRHVMPGPLSSAHASLQTDCANCHLTTIGSIKSPLHGLVTTQAGLDQSAKCVACHTFGDHTTTPHTEPPELIAQLTEEARNAAIIRGADPDELVPFAPYDQIGCAVCHHEHQGADASLISMTKRQCQACHVNAFTSLASGHPDFVNYPHQAPLQIAFNHASHLTRHFVGARKDHAPASCESCHTPSLTGREIGTLGFDSMCASCHSAQIAGDGRAGAKGIDVIALPAIDVLTLEDRGYDIGEWPADSRFLETKLTPFLELALLGDRSRGAVVETVHEIDLLDLRDADDAQLQAVTEYVWAIKQFLFELCVDGHRAMRTRVESALGRPLTRQESIGLLSQMPVDVVRSAQQVWLPNLIEEITSDRSISRVRPEAAPTQPAPVADAEDLAPIDEDDDLLLDDDMDLLALDDINEEDAEIERRAREANIFQASPEDWVASGGWHRRDETYTLAYRPTGHADEFLTCWLDVSGARAPGPGHAAAAHIFDELSWRDAPGMCTKCHTIDGDAENKKVNWVSSMAPRASASFTTFDHRPHLLIAGSRQCVSCHQLGAAAVIPIDRTGDETLQSRSAFAAIRKESCVECHTPDSAGDSCLMCHTYHATPATRSVHITPLPVTPEGE